MAVLGQQYDRRQLEGQGRFSLLIILCCALYHGRLPRSCQPTHHEIALIEVDKCTSNSHPESSFQGPWRSAQEAEVSEAAVRAH